MISTGLVDIWFTVNKYARDVISNPIKFNPTILSGIQIPGLEQFTDRTKLNTQI